MTPKNMQVSNKNVKQITLQIDLGMIDRMTNSKSH